jgi:hypothetical protein
MVLRKLVAAVTFLAVLALPAPVLAQPRWHWGSKSQVTVYVEETRVGATNWSYVKRSGIEWSRKRPHPRGLREALSLALFQFEGL